MSLPTAVVPPPAVAENMRDRTHRLDWASTTLDGIEAWPISLRGTVTLASKFPMYVIWGPQRFDMPGMNGYELARAIRQEAWGRDTLLNVATGWGHEDDSSRPRPPVSTNT